MFNKKVIIAIIGVFILLSFINKTTSAQDFSNIEDEKLSQCIMQIKYKQNYQVLEKDKHKIFLQCLKY